MKKLILIIAIVFSGILMQAQTSSELDIDFGQVPMVVYIGIAFLIYMLPTIVSMLRNSKNGLGIFLLNLFLGWTLIGFVAAFIWAFTAKTVKEYNHIYKNSNDDN